MKPGDTVFIRRAAALSIDEFVIDKVGRKWATYRRPGSTYDLGRIDIVSCTVDNGARSRVYASREEFEVEQLHYRAFDETSSRMRAVLQRMRAIDVSPAALVAMNAALDSIEGKTP